MRRHFDGSAARQWRVEMSTGHNWKRRCSRQAEANQLQPHLPVLGAIVAAAHPSLAARPSARAASSPPAEQPYSNELIADFAYLLRSGLLALPPLMLLRLLPVMPPLRAMAAVSLPWMSAAMGALWSSCHDSRLAAAMLLLVCAVAAKVVH